ncbi:MAG: ZIP family metal transporter [Candidatus Goldbacteria bacterium]|nr:ZIP family metal transporter [Candidatus Goldiibacteriota bacterium]
MNFIYAIFSSVFISLLSFAGAISLLLKEDLLKKTLLLLVAFSAGSLIGGAFLHLLPEGLEKLNNYNLTFLITITGITLFFILEKFLFWRHCHKGGKCDFHTFTYMNLIGDGIHNFIDGLIIGATFFVDIKLGLATVIAIIFHEIPQELGDFGVLIYGGMKKARALFLNFISSTAAIFGTLLGYFFSSHTDGFTSLLMPFAAGGFIYIASSDLIPELHKQIDTKKSLISIVFFIIGICFMYILKITGTE